MRLHRRAARGTRRPVLLAALVGLLLVNGGANAAVTIIGTFPIQQLILVVGIGSTINQVTMDVPAANLGNASAPVVGTPTIRITLLARAPGGTPDFVLSVDSSTPLSNGVATIPMTEIAWTSQDGEIAAAAFDGSTAQLLLQATPNRLVVDTLQFRYLNSTVPVAGTYLGRVRYTLAVP